MSDNLREFNLALEGAVKDMTESEVLIAHKALHMEGLARIVKRTPVDLGIARGNWQSTEGSPAAGQIPQRDVEAVMSEGRSVTDAIEPFSATYMTNNVDYITVLEEGGFVPADPGPSKDRRKDRKGRVLVKGGFSVQAPRGMVALTFEELKDSIS